MIGIGIIIVFLAFLDISLSVSPFGNPYDCNKFCSDSDIHYQYNCDNIGSGSIWTLDKKKCTYVCGKIGQSCDKPVANLWGGVSLEKKYKICCTDEDKVKYVKKDDSEAHYPYMALRTANTCRSGKCTVVAFARNCGEKDSESCDAEHELAHGKKDAKLLQLLGMGMDDAGLEKLDRDIDDILDKMM